MLGFIMSAIAGATMSIQGVFNTRLSEKIGLYESNAFVQGSAFVLSLIAVFIVGKGDFREIATAPKYCLLGGVLGLIITITVMLGISKLTPTLATSTILIAQLLVAAIIDAFGLFGTEKLSFGIYKYVGVAMMIGAVVLFKIK